MVICKQCGSPVDPSSMKCQVCGAIHNASGNPNKSNPGGYCGKCGTPLAAKYDPCSSCGHVKTTFAPPPPVTPSPQNTSPFYKGTGTAVALALIPGFFGICGIGHFYLNKIGRGIVLLVVGLILGAISWSSMGIGLVIFLPFLAWTVYDAHNLTKFYNNFVNTNRNTPW